MYIIIIRDRETERQRERESEGTIKPDLIHYALKRSEPHPGPVGAWQLTIQCTPLSFDGTSSQHAHTLLPDGNANALFGCPFVWFSVPGSRSPRFDALAWTDGCGE